MTIAALRNSLTEVGHVALGLAATALATLSAAWAYPVGAFVIHRVGAAAMIVVVLINIGALQAAWAKDRSRDG